MAAALERTLSSIEPDLTITVQSWPDALANEFFSAQAATVGLGIMGLLAAMLAVTGIFGMAAYSVSRRMKELGIRMALGARKTQVLSAAVGRPMVVLGIGSGAAIGRLRQPVARTDRVPGESAGSRGGGRRGVDDGDVGDCGVRDSGAARAWCRSI